jgi:hypothetical protein
MCVVVPASQSSPPAAIAAAATAEPLPVHISTPAQAAPHLPWSPPKLTQLPPATAVPPPRRNSRSHGWHRATPRSTIAGCSSAANNPWNGTLGEPTPLPRPFPAKPSLPLAGIELPPPPMARGTQLQSNFSSRGLICKTASLIVYVFC